MTDEYIKPRENGRNIVGCYMLRPFAHIVACCCLLLEVVAQSLKTIKRLAARKRMKGKATGKVQWKTEVKDNSLIVDLKRKDHCKLKLSTFPRISYWYYFRSGHHH